MTAAVLLRDNTEVARLGDIVAVDRRLPTGGRSWRDLRYRLTRVDMSAALVYGPLTEVDGYWVPMSGRVVRDYRVALDEIVGTL